MRSRSLMALVVVFIPFLASAQELFTSRELNFSVAEPPFASRWTSLPGESSVSATNDSGEQFTIWASPDMVPGVDERWVASLLAAASRHAAGKGAYLESVRITPAHAPFAHSFTFSYAIVSRDGSRQLVDGYAASAGRAYVLQYVSRDRASLELFRSLVSSFRVNDKLESYRGGATTASPASSASLMPAPIGRSIAPNGERPANPSH